MKYAVYSLLAFIAFLVFAPEAGSTEIRNTGLLIALASIAVIVLIIKFLRLIALAGDMKKKLKENKYKIKHTRFGIGKVYITAENHKEALKICLLKRKKEYLKYHFVNNGRIELYKTTVSAVRAGRDIAKVSKYSDVKKVGIIFIAKPKADSAKNFVVFDKFPTIVSDTSNRSLQMGDKITDSNTYVFDIKSFIESIK